MVKHKESLISAHHNYLVNHMLFPGLVMGDPNSEEAFYFLADMVLPGEDTPSIWARLFDHEGRFILELSRNHPVRNPGGCSHESAFEGFHIRYPTGELLLEVHTRGFANGYLTRVQGKLYDGQGRLRMDPTYEGNEAREEERTILDAPYEPS